MDYPRACGCKGRRTCLVCENEYDFGEKSFINDYKVTNHSFETIFFKNFAHIFRF